MDKIPPTSWDTYLWNSTKCITHLNCCRILAEPNILYMIFKAKIGSLTGSMIDGEHTIESRMINQSLMVIEIPFTWISPGFEGDFRSHH